MPWYDYECPTCGFEFEEQRAVADCHGARCTACGCVVNIIIGLPNVIVYGTYYDVGLDREITGPRHRQALMKAAGVEERGNMTLKECQSEQKRVENRNMPKCLPEGFLKVYDRVTTQSEGGTLPPGGFEGAHEG